MTRRMGVLTIVAAAVVAACGGSTEPSAAPGTATVSAAPSASSDSPSTAAEATNATVAATSMTASTEAATPAMPTATGTALPAANGLAYAGELVDGRFTWPIDMSAYRVPAETLHYGFDPPLDGIAPTEVGDEGAIVSGGPFTYALIAARGSADPRVMIQVDRLTDAERSSFDPMTMPGENVTIGRYSAAIRSNRAVFGPVDGYRVRLVGRLDRAVIEALILSFELHDGMASVAIPPELADSDPIAILATVDAEMAFDAASPLSAACVTYRVGEERIELTMHPATPLDPITSFAVDSDIAEPVMVGAETGAAVTMRSGVEIISWTRDGVTFQLLGSYEGVSRQVLLDLATRVRHFDQSEWDALVAAATG